MEAQETIRANKAKEAENYRTNKAKEDETNRSNLVNEKLAKDKLEYEKYGKDILGQSVRTIKAGISDAAAAVSSNAADTGKSMGYSTSIDRTTGKEIAGPTIGGVDIFGMAQKKFSDMSQKEFREYYQKYKNGEISLNSDAAKRLEELAKIRKVVK